MNSSLKLKLAAMAAAAVLNLSLAIGLHELATQHQAEEARQAAAPDDTRAG